MDCCCAMAGKQDMLILRGKEAVLPLSHSRNPKIMTNKKPKELTLHSCLVYAPKVVCSVAFVCHGFCSVSFLLAILR